MGPLYLDALSFSNDCFILKNFNFFNNVIFSFIVLAIGNRDHKTPVLSEFVVTKHFRQILIASKWLHQSNATIRLIKRELLTDTACVQLESSQSSQQRLQSLSERSLHFRRIKSEEVDQPSAVFSCVSRDVMNGEVPHKRKRLPIVDEFVNDYDRARLDEGGS